MDQSGYAPGGAISKTSDAPSAKISQGEASDGHDWGSFDWVVGTGPVRTLLCACG